MSLDHIDNKFANSELRIHEQEAAPAADKASHQETHIHVGELLKSFVYGGVDGSSNILIVITSGMSSGISAHEILAMCIAVCVGDGIVMGLGDYLSAKAEIDFISSEQRREEYQVDNLFQKEKQQIVDIYHLQKYSQQDCKRIAELYSSNKKAFVSIMMLQELHLVVADPVIAIKCGIVTFVSFLLFGILPVLPFIVTLGIMKDEQTKPWIASICIGGVEFISLGILKATIIGGNKLKSALEILIISSIATAIGFGIGFAFPN